MGQVTVHRDSNNRVVEVVVRGMDRRTGSGRSAAHLLRTVATSLAAYLHVAAESEIEIDGILSIDRSDSHLDRELDAVLETLVIGLKLLEHDDAADWVVHEADVGVEV